MNQQPLGWGILATGRIAEKFAKGVEASKTSRLVAVGSRNIASAQEFAQAHHIPIAHAHGSYEAFLQDPAVQAVYIATPHPMHCEWAIKAAQAGKHILCEKPLGMSREEGERMIAAARENNVLLMEAFMYRCHPQTAKIVELVSSGVLGEIRMVQAAFGYNSPFDPKSRAWANELGGGGILDVGCYPVSFSRLVAGAAEAAAGRKIQPYLDPTDINGAGVIHPQTGVDVYAAATLKFPGGMVAQVSTSVGVQQDNVARIYGTKGWLHVLEPWIPSRNEGKNAHLKLHLAGASAAEEIVIPYSGSEYTFEADAVAKALALGLREVPQMNWGDTLGNLETLDKWLHIVGVKYSQPASS